MFVGLIHRPPRLPRPRPRSLPPLAITPKYDLEWSPVDSPRPKVGVYTDTTTPISEEDTAPYVLDCQQVTDKLIGFLEELKYLWLYGRDAWERTQAKHVLEIYDLPTLPHDHPDANLTIWRTRSNVLPKVFESLNKVSVRWSDHRAKIEAKKAAAQASARTQSTQPTSAQPAKEATPPVIVLTEEKGAKEHPDQSAGKQAGLAVRSCSNRLMSLSLILQASIALPTIEE